MLASNRFVHLMAIKLSELFRIYSFFKPNTTAPGYHIILLVEDSIISVDYEINLVFSSFNFAFNIFVK